MAQLQIVKTDNRDPYTTTLSLGYSPKGGLVEHVVDVNPFELFKNMIENLPKEVGDTSEFQDIIDYLNDLVIGS